MSASASPSQLSDLLLLELLDADRSRSVQRWVFKLQPVVRIGRASDNDVVVGNPVVSRLHAELRWRDDGWELVSVGRHGTCVSGNWVAQARLEEGSVFQLGVNGPCLRFNPPLDPCNQTVRDPRILVQAAAIAETAPCRSPGEPLLGSSGTVTI